MSNLPTITVGNSHKGIVKGKVNFTGKSNVQTSGVHNYNIGGKTEGDVDENAVVKFDETITITAAKEENTDHNQQQEPEKSQVKKYQTNDEFRPIGSETIIKSDKSSVYVSNYGSATIAKFIKGSVTNTIIYNGNGVHIDDASKNLPSGVQSYLNIGDIVITKHLEGDATYVSDINIKQKINENSIKIKGHVTIFNQDFKDTNRRRNGSDKDVKSLCATFKRFGIESTVEPSDLKYKDIVRSIDNLSKTNFSDYKLFVCVLMTHGDKNGIVSAADKEFNLHETIIDPIMRIRSLNGIAKIFITVACRGSNNYYECDGEECDGNIISTKNGIDYSNCIISYSTYEGHVSKRTESGTYFIQELCKNINEDNGEAKIHSYFAKVNDSLAKMYKQVPLFQSTMGDISFNDLASTS